MKYFIMAIIAYMCFIIPANCQELQTTMRVKDSTGEIVTVTLDACYDPVTKSWGPCYILKSSCSVNLNKK
jgi:hypothetical protein